MRLSNHQGGLHRDLKKRNDGRGREDGEGRGGLGRGKEGRGEEKRGGERRAMRCPKTFERFQCVPGNLGSHMHICSCVHAQENRTISKLSTLAVLEPP